MKYTLKVSLVGEDGTFYPFGTVLDDSKIPNHLRIPKYVARGIVNVVRHTPIDYIDLEEVKINQNGHAVESSPMTELEL